MRTFETVVDLRTWLDAQRAEGREIGLVPTMGALHEGHLALVRRARADGTVVVATIFVNPTQFGPGEDFARYPRDLAHDTELLAAAGAGAVFAPAASEVYPPGDTTRVRVPALAARWEGEARPGHFEGVATVCTKLFNIVGPCRAYFGRKDYQQLALLRRLVVDLFLPIDLVAVSTVREPDGLALSSRNAYLNPPERAAALVLSRALREAQGLWRAGERSATSLEAAMRAVVEAEPLARLDYAAVVNPESLEPVEAAVAESVALIAVCIGSTRLIDNVTLEEEPLPGSESPARALDSGRKPLA